MEASARRRFQKIEATLSWVTRQQAAAEVRAASEAERPSGRAQGAAAERKEEARSVADGAAVLAAREKAGAENAAAADEPATVRYAWRSRWW